MNITGMNSVLMTRRFNWQLFHFGYICEWTFSMCCKNCCRTLCRSCSHNYLWARQEWFCSGMLPIVSRTYCYKCWWL